MSVRNDISNGKYTNTQQYPDSPRKPRLSSAATAAQAKMFSLELENWEKKNEITKALRVAYDDEEARLMHEFRIDAIAEVFGDDASRFPKIVNHLYGLAYDAGHANGYNEVLNQLEEFSDIIEVIRQDLK